MNPYKVLKAICPITTTPREGVNLEKKWLPTPKTAV